MSALLHLTHEIIEEKNPKIKQALDPHLTLRMHTKPYLEARYQSIDLLEKIHPSHFELLFESYPKKDIQQIITLITAKGSLLSTYARSITFKALNKHYPTLPYKYLSSFRGEALLFLNGAKLKTLLHLLGVYDIKTFLRTSIDQKLNLEITQALNNPEKEFLKFILKEKEKVSFKKMPLDTWDKQKGSFETMLYLRGLNRLSKTLAFENSFIQQEIILRLPLKEKTQFLTLATQTDDLLNRSLYEELDSALSWLETTHPTL